jgi:hypothetical protein
MVGMNPELDIKLNRREVKVTAFLFASVLCDPFCLLTHFLLLSSSLRKVHLGFVTGFPKNQLNALSDLAVLHTHSTLASSASLCNCSLRRCIAH